MQLSWLAWLLTEIVPAIHEQTRNRSLIDQRRFRKSNKSAINGNIKIVVCPSQFSLAAVLGTLTQCRQSQHRQTFIRQSLYRQTINRQDNQQTRQLIDTTIKRQTINRQTINRQDNQQTRQLIDRQEIDSIRQLIEIPRQEIDKTTYRQTRNRHTQTRNRQDN